MTWTLRVSGFWILDRHFPGARSRWRERSLCDVDQSRSCYLAQRPDPAFQEPHIPPDCSELHLKSQCRPSVGPRSQRRARRVKVIESPNTGRRLNGCSSPLRVLILDSLIRASTVQSQYSALAARGGDMLGYVAPAASRAAARTA